MHIVEGFLPLTWCIVWIVISLIFVIYGIRQMITVFREVPEAKKIFSISFLFMLIVQLLGFNLVTGTTSSPFGNALGGSIFGPAITSVIAAFVLIIHALLLGYGGLTTIGANIFSMGVVGPFVAYLIFKAFTKRDISPYIAIVLASFLANICTALTTAVQFGLVFGGILKFVVIFIISQIPFIVIDVIVTTVAFMVVYELYKKSEIFSPDFKLFNFR